LLDHTIEKIDPASKIVVDGEGSQFTYEKLLLATGGEVRTLPFGRQSIQYYRTYADFQSLSQRIEGKKSIGVIGSGFIGSEIAAALSQKGNEVHVFDMGLGIGWNIFPKEMVAFLNQYYSDHNVTVHMNTRIQAVDVKGYKIGVKVSEEQTIFVDEVVAGIGIQPRVDLAKQAGLVIDDGIVVNQLLKSSCEAIYAAGDVANFYNPALDKRLRVEHADNAKAMGKIAGRIMAGGKEFYDYLPLFYSDLFDLGYEAVGELDARYEIIEDWQEKFKKGVLYYIEGNRVRGVLLWNVWGKVDAAREMIASSEPINRKNLVGRIS